MNETSQKTTAQQIEQWIADFENEKNVTIFFDVCDSVYGDADNSGLAAFHGLCLWLAEKVDVIAAEEFQDGYDAGFEDGDAQCEDLDQ